jgi:hypothetical protein
MWCDQMQGSPPRLFFSNVSALARGLLLPPGSYSQDKRTEELTMGAILPWKPFRELERMMRRLDSPLRLFEDLDDEF